MSAIFRAISIGAALLGVACASGPENAPITSSALESHRTLAELKGFLGAQRSPCVHSRTGYSLCGWQISNRDSAWAALAGSIGTRYPMNVICELPSDGTPRGPDSCYVYPRIALSYEAALRRANPDVIDVPRDAAARKRESSRVLASATRLFDVSKLVGAPPDRCLRRSEDRQLCRWQLSNQTPGHAFIAAIIEEDHRVVLACMFPYADEARDKESCEVRLRR